MALWILGDIFQLVLVPVVAVEMLVWVDIVGLVGWVRLGWWVRLGRRLVVALLDVLVKVAFVRGVVEGDDVGYVGGNDKVVVGRARVLGQNAWSNAGQGNGHREEVGESDHVVCKVSVQMEILDWKWQSLMVFEDAERF